MNYTEVIPTHSADPIIVDIITPVSTPAAA